MTSFKLKSIKAEATLGESLSQKRVSRELSLANAASQTNISLDYLEALESGHYDRLPGDVYARNFLKRYASWLGLDVSESLQRYQQENKIFNQTQQKSVSRNFEKPVEKLSAWRLVVTPKLIRNFIIVILAVSCIVYLGFKVQNIFAKPYLEVDLPSENLVINQKVIEISGHSEIGAVVKINGQEVLTDDNGNFSELLSLQDGSNIIEITAQKKHSKQAQLYRQIIVQESGS